MQMSETLIGTNFEPSEACILMDKMKTIFLKTQQL